MFNDYLYANDARCMHRNVKLVTSGQRTFSAGEVWDDITDLLVCIDCLCVLSEAEIRSTWTGRSMFFQNPGSRKHHGRH